MLPKVIQARTVMSLSIPSLEFSLWNTSKDLLHVSNF
uniref:Uncharacterized protein n=1 Tax=Rhizophora mucronata TaxID=61149 RepID=A0A2P2N922_RHIMU